MKEKGKRFTAKASKDKFLSEKDLRGFLPESVTLVEASSRGTNSSLNSNLTTLNNIENGITPFRFSTVGVDKSNVSVSEAITLCQKAYYNFAIIRNTIDIMTEFSSARIFFKDGSKKSREFFKAYFNRINIKALQDKFFREYYRSGNVFLYRVEGQMKPEDVKKITQVYGAEAKNAILPIRYIILNPAEIQAGGSVSFANTQYYKTLTDYELERLRKPRSEEDKRVFDTLPPEIKSQIGKKGTVVQLPLSSDYITAVFYKKQDYEPMAIPMAYPVLYDVNWKAEMKKMDLSAMRTMQQVILLITMGNEPDKGGVNPAHISAIRGFFENESVARVLVADYTTKAEFVIPQIADLLDPKKYEVIDRDIREGLNNLLISAEDKYANAQTKVQVFTQRLVQAREAFLNDFLIEEIKRISNNLGFKVYPIPYFEDIDFKNEADFARIYTRLAEIGVLTPEETLEAFDSGKLPIPEESLESQAKYRQDRDKGLYEPIQGGPYTQEKLAKLNAETQKELSAEKAKQLANSPKAPSQTGRPSGTNTKQTVQKKVTPIGASQFSLSKIVENLKHFDIINEKVGKALANKFNIKELNNEQKEIAAEISELIAFNESPDKWDSVIETYVSNPIGEDNYSNEIISLAAEHGLNNFMASILYWSKK
jgi:hypothetical protein